MRIQRYHWRGGKDGIKWQIHDSMNLGFDSSSDGKLQKGLQSEMQGQIDILQILFRQEWRVKCSVRTVSKVFQFFRSWAIEVPDMGSQKRNTEE